MILRKYQQEALDKMLWSAKLHGNDICVIPTGAGKSLALYYQILGRGVRIAEGKTTCYVIDLTNTVAKLGRIETIKLDKVDNGKWDIITETGKWHNRSLYKYEIPTQPKLI
jgi:superfamily II DNA or RNA helicase